MENYSYKIIMPTTINYLDITKNFIDLLKINWPSAIKNLIITTVGKRIPSKLTKDGVKFVENNEGTTLPRCVFNASQKYSADFYFIFLGDAFISKKVNIIKLKELLATLRRNRIEYCKLVPQFTWHCISDNQFYRYINSDERYAHSFVAFIANDKFIKDEFSNDITDRDFEIKYLKLSLKKKHIVYNNRVILKNNLFNILPSIQKGKWDRINKRKLSHKYPQISFAKRGKVSIKYEMGLKIGKIVSPIMPNKFRIFLKNKLKNKSSFFNTKI